MSVQQRMVISGLSAANVQAILGTVASSLTATGSTQATALALGADINYVTTVAASTGVAIAALNPGDESIVYNKGANALLLYPPTGAVINGLSANTGYSIATATPYAVITCVTPLIYIAKQSA